MFKLMALLLLLLPVAAQAQTRTAEEQAQRMAKNRGYTAAQASCFSNLFVKMATLGPDGRWRPVFDKRAGSGGFRNQVIQTCGFDPREP